MTIGTVAGRWRDALLSSLAAIFAVATVAAAFAWRRTPAPDADVGFAVIALAFGALWWAAAVVAKRKGWASGPARLWADPLRLGGILLSAFAIGGSAVGLVTGVLGSDRAFTISLALVGFFALGLAVLEGREGLSYMAVLMLGSAWGLWAYGRLGVRQGQVYAIPGGLYLLWVGLMQHRHARPRLAAVIDIAGLVLLLGSSLLQSVTQALASASLIYGALVAAEAIGILWWGLIRRLRRFVIAGIGVFAIDLVAQVVQPLLSMSRWVLTALVGLVLVVGALVVERQRETIKRVSHEWRSRMEAWH